MAMASRDLPRAAARELDDVTLARAIRGERPALEQLVAHHQALVWSYLWRMLRPRATRSLVQDLFQETFLGVHRGLPRFSAAGPARLSTWILAIATRVTLSHLRRQRRHGETAPPEAEASDGGAGVAGLERQALVAALGRALAGLTVEHRAIVLLRDYHGLEYEEIARALEIELGTVASRLNRARATLRLALAEHDPSSSNHPSRSTSRSPRNHPSRSTTMDEKDLLGEAMDADAVPPPPADLAGQTVGPAQPQGDHHRRRTPRAGAASARWRWRWARG